MKQAFRAHDVSEWCSGLGMFSFYIKCLSIFSYHTGFQYRSFPFQEMGSATISFKCMWRGIHEHTAPFVISIFARALIECASHHLLYVLLAGKAHITKWLITWESHILHEATLNGFLIVYCPLCQRAQQCFFYWKKFMAYLFLGNFVQRG